MNTNGRKQDARSQVKGEGLKPQQSAGVEPIKITRTAWGKTPKDYKDWLVVDGKRVRAVMTYRRDGGQGVCLMPVQIIPDSEG
ncbi:hypothetical protein [Acidiferrobacter sp.]|uniref:hypothetical protein n=1 Tax=Acidiferrobacter sp. TaxID=1872107 RepID=UPI002639358A|nr:hypothetical protein [Acidiferrobacter sp.]